MAAVEGAAAPEAEGELEEVAVWAGDMAAVRDMAAQVVSATAVRHRLQGTRCKQRFRARMRMERIMAHQALA
ncbi:hypothetical protein [Bradyrhizobium iriomotense]|uniref:Transposase n=1 Tax=Bradyrhizobium iriomotense TaxID=441950 RepID=A0ABQ6AXJ1_9BRAD|nr:hypothetical protein [Bradyrhizobium iriomotense]GLR86909.1 hypothetical protein GCM10007857_36200 [Bradyrhizobium iriomotense]